MKYDLIVFIGRMRPQHLAHTEILQRASNLAHKTLVLVGSANSPRTIKNMLTYEEVAENIRASTHIRNLEIEPLNDYLYY